MVKFIVTQGRCVLLSLIGLVLLSLGQVAYAHNVIGGVYAIGDVIEGEIAFSSGDMAAEGTEVQVLNSQGEELGRVTTNDEGLFSFKATQRMEYRFYANLSSGHIFEATLPAEELPESLGTNGEKSAVAEPREERANASETTSFAGDEVQLQAMIEKAVAKQIKPLRQEINAMKEKAGLQDIIGGIGYIFGLCGIGIWWRQRQLAKQKSV